MYVIAILLQFNVVYYSIFFYKDIRLSGLFFVKHMQLYIKIDKTLFCCCHNWDMAKESISSSMEESVMLQLYCCCARKCK
ncbi:hypothetical protein XELAEV_18015445mg [Xenopus laevis]|uniref:Uncharacterized protein n=1 Tax=Xenopus laevis TaxID=8355 RepID=A0A974HWD1_XENLA|nr:hypothetical protein XELAEV_18015445mg [Xenopus laevis]